MTRTLSQYEADCLQDYGYLPDLEEADPELESLAATPEGKGWERVQAVEITEWSIDTLEYAEAA